MFTLIWMTLKYDVFFAQTDVSVQEIRSAEKVKSEEEEEEKKTNISGRERGRKGERVRLSHQFTISEVSNTDVLHHSRFEGMHVLGKLLQSETLNVKNHFYWSSLMHMHTHTHIYTHSTDFFLCIEPIPGEQRTLSAAPREWEQLVQHTMGFKPAILW